VRRLKKLMIEELLFLNQYIQNVVQREAINNWFLSFDEMDRQAVVSGIWVLAWQARAVRSDFAEAAVAAGLNPTHTPVVAASNKETQFRYVGFKLAALKGPVLEQAFWFSLELYALAERRRKREKCSAGCNHWWHKDLSDKRVVKKILKDS
jgi:hypothetical protein